MTLPVEADARRMTRRLALVLLLAAAGLLAACGKPAADVPAGDFMPAADLARIVADPAATPPTILYVGPAVLFARHVPGAILTGEAGTPEGLAKLRAAAERLPRTADVVVYCGCCATAVCPNIRPAYAALKAMGFARVRVLDLPENFRANWKSLGYPVEQGAEP